MESELRRPSFTLRVHGDLAVATHEYREELRYFGQTLRSRFRTTDTWLRTKAGWRTDRGAGAGRADEAFTWLARALKARSRQLMYATVDPVHDPLRDDPRFIQLLRRMQLA